MRAYLSEMVTGWDVDQVRGVVAETLHDLIDPMVFAEAAELIEQHQALGHDVVIVSTSGTEVVEPIGEMLGADHVIATRMVVEDGRYTGGIDYYAYGPTKAEAVRDLAASHGYDLAAILRLQRLLHGSADARGGGPSACGQPRQGAAERSPRNGSGRFCCSPGRWPCAALPGCGCEHAAEGCRSGGGQRGSRRHRLVRPPA